MVEKKKINPPITSFGLIGGRGLGSPPASPHILTKNLLFFKLIKAIGGTTVFALVDSAHFSTANQGICSDLDIFQIFKKKINLISSPPLAGPPFPLNGPPALHV